MKPAILTAPAASAEMSLSDTSLDSLEDQLTGKEMLPAASPETWLSSVFCVPALDRLHDDFLRGMVTTAGSDNHAFSTRYRSFVSLAEHTFRQEEQWMEEVDLFILKTH